MGQKSTLPIKNVMIIDDDSSIREIAYDMLTHLGFKPITAGSGSEGLKIPEDKIKNKDNIEAIILNLHLKNGENSIEIMKKIESIQKNVRVIICSGSPNDPFLIRYTKYGFDAALSKPFRLKDLKNVL